MGISGLKKKIKANSYCNYLSNPLSKHPQEREHREDTHPASRPFQLREGFLRAPEILPYVERQR